MANIFSELIYRPILNLTILLYATVGFGDLGIAIIAMTVAVRLLLAPLSIKAARSQRELATLAPHIEELKAKHKGDNNAQSAAVMQLYRERGINPLAGCLPLLIQLPILIGMYRVFLNIFKPESLGLLYSFVTPPSVVNQVFLGLIDISAPSRILAIIAGILQFLQARLTGANQPQSSQTASLNKQMTYLFPIMIVVISWNLPAGLALYWAATTLFSIGEQLYLRRR